MSWIFYHPSPRTIVITSSIVPRILIPLPLPPNLGAITPCINGITDGKSCFSATARILEAMEALNTELGEADIFVVPYFQNCANHPGTLYESPSILLAYTLALLNKCRRLLGKSARVPSRCHRVMGTSSFDIVDPRTRLVELPSFFMGRMAAARLDEGFPLVRACVLPRPSNQWRYQH